MPSLEDRVDALEARNRRVEAEKAWETSLTRRIGVTLMTYVIATLTLAVIGTEIPYIMAFIPTLGYALSTLTLPFLRKRWEDARRAR